METPPVAHEFIAIFGLPPIQPWKPLRGSQDIFLPPRGLLSNDRWIFLRPASQGMIVHLYSSVCSHTGLRPLLAGEQQRKV